MIYILICNLSIVKLKMKLLRLIYWRSLILKKRKKNLPKLKVHHFPREARRKVADVIE